MRVSRVISFFVFKVQANDREILYALRIYFPLSLLDQTNHISMNYTMNDVILEGLDNAYSHSSLWFHADHSFSKRSYSSTGARLKKMGTIWEEITSNNVISHRSIYSVSLQSAHSRKC